MRKIITFFLFFYSSNILSIIGRTFPGFALARPVFREANNQVIAEGSDLQIYSDNYEPTATVFGRPINSFFSSNNTGKNNTYFSQQINFGLLNQNLLQWLVAENGYVYIANPEKVFDSQRTQSFPIFQLSLSQINPVEQWKLGERPIFAKLTQRFSRFQLGMFDIVWIDNQLNLWRMAAVKVTQVPPSPTCPNGYSVEYNQVPVSFGKVLLDIVMPGLPNDRRLGRLEVQLQPTNNQPPAIVNPQSEPAIVNPQVAPEVSQSTSVSQPSSISSKNNLPENDLSKNNKSMTDGQIAGAVIGSVSGAALVVGGGAYLLKKYRNRKKRTSGVKKPYSQKGSRFSKKRNFGILK